MLNNDCRVTVLNYSYNRKFYIPINHIFVLNIDVFTMKPNLIYLEAKAFSYHLVNSRNLKLPLVISLKYCCDY